jgi:hypothetical protein
MDSADFEPELARWEAAQRDHARAQLRYFRTALELCRQVRQYGVPGVTEIAGESVRLHRTGRVEITYQGSTYTLDQLPGLIQALEDALS